MRSSLLFMIYLTSLFEYQQHNCKILKMNRMRIITKFLILACLVQWNVKTFRTKSPTDVESVINITLNLFDLVNVNVYATV